MLSNYSSVASDTLPSQPPAYGFQDIFFRDALEQRNLMQPVEQFETDEDDVVGASKRGSTSQWLEFQLKYIFLWLKQRIVALFVRLISPLQAASDFVSTHCDQVFFKIGNPLVVKRLLYVVIVILATYAIPKDRKTNGISEVGGGAFSSGNFYDVENLGNNLKLFLNPKSLKENTEYLSSVPHFAGTTGDLALAKYVESYFSNIGLSVIDFHEMDSFLNYPKRENTYLKHADGTFEATLYEEQGGKMQNWAFSPNSPSSDGEIYSPYLYLGHGCASDFEKLLQAGIDIRGAILLIKFGGNIPEANKVAAAHEHGASAVVFITPSVNWAGTNHDDAIQKVNVGLTRHSPGDVLAPGWSSRDSQSSRLSWNESDVTAKLPCIPISFRDAKQLLLKIESRGVRIGNDFWSGDRSALDMIKLRINQEERVTHLIWNVLGSIKGREQANKGIIYGAPRDSIGYGASYSASSTAVLLELAKAFTSLQRKFDWTPARSIYFISFDATEYNLAGSAQWVESKKQQLQEEGFTYIEVSDIYSGDVLSVTANPLLHDVLKEEMRKVEFSRSSEFPNAMVSLYDLFKEQHGGSGVISNNFIQTKDFIPFINLANIPSLDIGFRSRKADTPKNSCLDSFSNMEKQFNHIMLRHLAILELLARVGLRMVEDPLIPYNFNNFEDYLRRSLKDLKIFALDFVARFQTDVTTHMIYDSLSRGIDRLADGVRMIEGFRKDWAAIYESSPSREPVMVSAARRATNDNMILFNTFFLAKPGIPDRTGYLNFLFGLPYDAPSFQDETYDWTSFPMVRTYIMKGEFVKAQYEISRISELLRKASEALHP